LVGLGVQLHRRFGLLFCPPCFVCCCSVSYKRFLFPSLPPFVSQPKRPRLDQTHQQQQHQHQHQHQQYQLLQLQQQHRYPVQAGAPQPTLLNQRPVQHSEVSCGAAAPVHPSLHALAARGLARDQVPSQQARFSFANPSSVVAAGSAASVAIAGGYASPQVPLPSPAAKAGAGAAGIPPASVQQQAAYNALKAKMAEALVGRKR
jgi:hypothetical protein